MGEEAARSNSDSVREERLYAVQAEAARLLVSMEEMGLSLAAAYLSMSLDALDKEMATYRVRRRAANSV